ncbi:MAG: hypothetical protein ACRDRP_21145 [Pseudonocardiaceae bacterium]
MDALPQGGDLGRAAVAVGVAGQLAQIVGSPAGAHGTRGVERGLADDGGFGGVTSGHGQRGQFGLGDRAGARVGVGVPGNGIRQPRGGLALTRRKS